jgi:hypothetical protein
MGMIIRRSKSNATPPLKNLTHFRHDTVHCEKNVSLCKVGIKDKTKER